MHIGLDFGTTNSSVGVYDGEHLRLLELDPANSNPSIMRSTLLLTREHTPLIGRAAIDHYIESNVGREIDYQWRYIGAAELTLADVGTVMQALYAPVDANAPGRLFQSLKSALRERGFNETSVFGRRYTLESLIAVVLRLLLVRVEEQLGAPVTSIVMGRPVHYAADPEADQLAFQRMQTACRHAQLPPVRFLEEPTAAALAYARTAHTGQNVLLFDFGGGTLDVTIMRLDGKGRRAFLATDGVPVGGDVLDQRIVMGCLLPHFGAGATVGPRRLPLPVHILEHLGEWQSIFDLTQPRYQTIIDEAILTSDKPRELRALRTLVQRNYGLPLYETVERAKVALSEQPDVTISMHVDEIDFAEPLPRWEFNRLIGPDVRTVERCITRALAQANLTPADIDVVLRTGGSSRIPRFITMLSTMFGADKLQEMDIFTGVTAGLAIAAWEQARRKEPGG